MTEPLPGKLACPACGVAVVPGYVRCPKCHAGLPFGSGRQKRTTIDPGGTSMASIKPPSALPVVAILGVLVVGGGIAIAIALSRGSSSSTSPAPAHPTAKMPTAARPPTPSSEIVVPPPSTTTTTAVAPNPDGLASDLHLALQHLRIYASVHASGNRLDVRSAQCNEADMTATITQAKDNLRAAGLTRWKCVEESGTPVFERDL